MCSRYFFTSFAGLILFALSATQSLAADSPQPADPSVGGPRFEQQKYLVVDDKPRLVIGCYEMPKEDAALKELADNGFNLVCAHSKADLDRAAKNGLFAWIPVGAGYGAEKPEQQKQLGDKIRELKDHPALLVWELPDEILWNVWWSHSAWCDGEQSAYYRKKINEGESATQQEKARWHDMVNRAADYQIRALFQKSEAIYEELRKELKIADPQPDAKFSLCLQKAKNLAAAVADDCRLIREIDPTHAIWQNHAPRNGLAELELFNRAVNAAGCDIYPVNLGFTGHSDLRGVTLACVGDYTERMKAAAPGKSVWMVLQGFGWRDLNPNAKNSPDTNMGRRPNLHETRFMAYDALVRGSGAILYWGTAYIEKDSQLWKDLLAVARELRSLEPAIVGQPPEQEPRSIALSCRSSVDAEDGPRLMLRRTGDDWLLIAVNELNAPVPFAVEQLPAELEGKTLYRLGKAESHTVEDGRFDDGMQPFGVHVYSTAQFLQSSQASKP